MSIALSSLRSSMFFLALLPLFSIGCAAEQSAKIPAADQGSWMTLAQAKELMAYGQVHDSVGNGYNFCPLTGYVPPAQYAGKCWSQAWQEVSFTSRDSKGEEMSSAMGETLEWGWNNRFTRTVAYETGMRDVFWKWGIQGAGTAWSKNFSKANEVVRRRAFGWVLAYPWATTCSIGDNLFRVPAATVAGSVVSAVGLGGGAVTGAGSTVVAAIIPVPYVVKPVVVATGYATAGTVVPLGEWTWQTAAAPLACTLSGRPNPEFVVKHWVELNPINHFKSDPARQVPRTVLD